MDDRNTEALKVIVVPIKNLKNETVGEASLPESIFGVTFKSHVVWETVKAIRAASRAGTHKTKTRSEVSGSGKKPFKQKHTGRARQGGGRPPIHRHGGTVHGPTPRSYALGINRGTKKAALRCVLSERLRENKLVLIESLALPTHRTKDLAEIVKGLGLTGKALLVDRHGNKNLTLAAANNPKVEAIDALSLNAYNGLNAETIVLTEEALRAVSEVLG